MKIITVLSVAFLILTLFASGYSDNTPNQVSPKLIVCSTIGPIAFIA